MIEKLEGIIIRETPYSESSKIINVITKEHGLVSILCKGARRLKNGLYSTTTKLNYAHFNVYYKEGKLSTLIEMDIIDKFKNVKTDIKKISYVTFITEIISQALKHEKNEELFDILISAIKKIDEGYDEIIITNILELKVLDYLGIKPSLDECVFCGNKDNIITINADKGGYICKGCYKNEKIVDEKTIKLIRMLYYVDISKISKTDINELIKREIDEFINLYYDQYSGLHLKSKDFLKNLKKY